MNRSTAPLLYGHRGAPARGIAENTLESFDQAVTDGATALETDVHLTRDGHVVISHDPSLARVFGVDVEIAHASLAEVTRKAPVPTLDALLRRFPTLPINVDLKAETDDIDRRVLDVIDAHGARDRVLLASFHKHVLARARALGDNVRTGLTRNEVLRLLGVPRLALKVWRIQGLRAQVPMRVHHLRFDTPRFVSKCHALGIAVDYWTINDLDDAKRLLALGADGIMSDAPHVVRAAFG